LIWLIGCAAPEKTIVQPVPFPEGVMNARWGTSVEQVKGAIVSDGNRWFQKDTDKPPFVLYASGSYLDAPAALSYFFTPKSGRLFRVDVTFNDVGIYERAKEHLIQRFKIPAYSQAHTNFWSWRDDSLLILQKNSTHVQISYSSGPFLRINHQESAGVIQK
jgi:hypothetical protein